MSLMPLDYNNSSTMQYSIRQDIQYIVLLNSSPVLSQDAGKQRQANQVPIEKERRARHRPLSNFVLLVDSTGKCSHFTS